MTEVVFVANRLHMDGIDFSSYLAEHGTFSSDEEDTAELEAELYSKFHHQASAHQEPNDLHDEEVFDTNVVESHGATELNLSSSSVGLISSKANLQICTDPKDGNLRASQMAPSKTSLGQPTVHITSNSPDDSKYVFKAPITRRGQEQDESSASSDDDSSIQIVSEVTKKPTVPKLVDLIHSDSSDDEAVEELPSFFKTPVQEERPKRIIVEVEEEKSACPAKRSKRDVVFTKGNSVNKHFRFRNSSSSSSDSFDEDEAILENDIQINVLGRYTGERTFSEVIGMKSDSKYETVNKLSKWSAEMHDFYDNINEHMIDITNEKLLAQVPNNADWTVRKPHASSVRSLTPSRYFHGRRCINCNRDGHSVKSCPEPKRRLVCSMCCETGHRSYQCPKEHCLRCSAAGEPYSENCRKCRYLDTMQCRLCGGCGHVQSRCPDTWRRYHATLRHDKIVQPQGEDHGHAPASSGWCCNCGRQGHYVHQCRGYRFSSLPTPVLSIVSYHEPQRHFDTSTDESRSAKKRRLREEMRVKRRAYLSLPSTPSRKPSDNGMMHSYPVTPVTDHGRSRNVDQTLRKAKDKLQDIVMNKKKKKRFNSSENSMSRTMKRKLRKKEKPLPVAAHDGKISKKQMRKEVKALKSKMGSGERMSTYKTMAVKNLLASRSGL